MREPKEGAGRTGSNPTMKELYKFNKFTFKAIVGSNGKELGIGIVVYGPLGRGFFGGKGVSESVYKHSLPHLSYSSENLEKSKALYVRVGNLAKKHQCSTTQLALSWVLHQGDDIVPIPATTKIKNVDSNIGALQMKLTEDDLRKFLV
ncbi:probable aldo-keto reductase 1 [Dioscorea cayenensis subsp. rotundata]|uniref:Probable aldo-keto reductase 1 n=1 Tax=Dioscorea cayennensis subsp. rotundata TaxID=55577 RepID=A0AB40CLL6_DIOCR|nr:probable aldo-keto reductase 1 [Dioscorea cayenensis subsp. rotundata]